jgi:hypothetical protein
MSTGFQVKGPAGEIQDHEGSLLGRLQQRAAGHGAGLEAVDYYDPPNMTLSVRRLYLRAGYRRRYLDPPRCGASMRSTIAGRASTRW